jgi:hypothetical protein
MSPRDLLVVVLLVSLVNGLASPAVLLVVLVSPVWMPAFVPITQESLVYGASLIVSIGTLLVAGVPAALYERMRGQRHSDNTSMIIWLAASVVLTLPVLTRLL